MEASKQRLRWRRNKDNFGGSIRHCVQDGPTQQSDDGKIQRAVPVPKGLVDKLRDRQQQRRARRAQFHVAYAPAPADSTASTAAPTAAPTASTASQINSEANSNVPIILLPNDFPITGTANAIAIEITDTDVEEATSLPTLIESYNSLIDDDSNDDDDDMDTSFSPNISTMYQSMLNDAQGSALVPDHTYGATPLDWHDSRVDQVLEFFPDSSVRQVTELLRTHSLSSTLLLLSEEPTETPKDFVHPRRDEIISRIMEMFPQTKPEDIDMFIQHYYTIQESGNNLQNIQQQPPEMDCIPVARSVHNSPLSPSREACPATVVTPLSLPSATITTTTSTFSLSMATLGRHSLQKSISQSWMDELYTKVPSLNLEPNTDSLNVDVYQYLKQEKTKSVVQATELNSKWLSQCYDLGHLEESSKMAPIVTLSGIKR